MCVHARPVSIVCVRACVRVCLCVCVCVCVCVPKAQIMNSHYSTESLLLGNFWFTSGQAHIILTQIVKTVQVQTEVNNYNGTIESRTTRVQITTYFEANISVHKHSTKEKHCSDHGLVCGHVHACAHKHTHTVTRVHYPSV